MRNSRAGFSLIEILIVVGIISISAMAIASMFTDQMKAARSVQALSEATYVVGDVKELLAGTMNCSINFGPLSGSALDPLVATTMQNLKRDNGGPTLVAYALAPQQYGNGTLEIESITFGPANYAGAHPSPMSFITPLNIVLRKTGATIGPAALRTRAISIHTMTDALGKVRICSAAGLSSFTQESITPDGYVVFPNGLVVQWGRANATPNGQTTISFPLPFPNQVFSITVSGTGDSGSNSKDNWPSVLNHPSSTTKSSFRVHNANDSSDPISWMAIGN